MPDDNGQSRARARIERIQQYLDVTTPADEVIIGRSDRYERLEEGKWIAGDFPNQIRIDRNTHLLSGDKHAHIHDRKGNELYALTQNAKPSHGSKSFKLSKDQADALRAQGFPIPKNRIVEAVLIGTQPFVIHG